MANDAKIRAQFHASPGPAEVLMAKCQLPLNPITNCGPVQAAQQGLETGGTDRRDSDLFYICPHPGPDVPCCRRCPVSSCQCAVILARAGTRTVCQRAPAETPELGCIPQGPRAQARPPTRMCVCVCVQPGAPPSSRGRGGFLQHLVRVLDPRNGRVILVSVGGVLFLGAFLKNTGRSGRR